jgi:hypothetical protein
MPLVVVKVTVPSGPPQLRPAHCSPPRSPVIKYETPLVPLAVIESETSERSFALTEPSRTKVAVIVPVAGSVGKGDVQVVSPAEHVYPVGRYVPVPAIKLP